MAGWKKELAEQLPGGRVSTGVSLRGLTTLRIGGAAECLAEPRDEEELLRLFEVIHKHGLPFFIFGKGSNVLVPDEGMTGVAVRLGKGFQEVRRRGPRVTAGAGCANPRFLEHCRRWGLGGMEFLIAVPGTIGGAIAMNAGAHEGETSAFLKSVRYFSTEAGMVEEDAGGIVFDYRTSPLRGQLGRVVISGEFALEEMAEEEIRERIAGFQSYRRESQPRDFPNCGSVFKNPSGYFAARLIEEAGLKGWRMGGAQVSEKHANFIVNRGDATSADVVALIDFIQERVYSLSGIKLELELQVL